MTSPSADPQRILIVRLSALGDVVMASGLIPALRTRFPSAEISWLCEPACVPLLKHHRDLHQVLVWPRAQWQQLWREKRWLDLWKAVRDFRKLLRAQRFDLALDAQGLLKSGLCTWFTGAPRRLSILAREGSKVLVHEKLVPPPNTSNIISSEYRYLAHYLGAPEGSFQLNLALGDAQRATARQVLSDAGIELSGTSGNMRRFAALCPFTTRPQKHWFEDRWAELAEALHQQGFTPVIFGGPADSEAAARIAARSPHSINLSGRLKLDETAAALAEASLLVGVDTGLTHMGTALRVPTVALFGSTRPYLQTGSALTRVLYEPLPCSPCRRNPTCDGRFDCMRAHTVTNVLNAALAVRNARLGTPGVPAA